MAVHIVKSLWQYCQSSSLVPLASVLLVLLECLLVPLVIWKIPYTEIDWKAYMQEVEGFLNGTTDYYLLKGDTGPLVYPGGFVYIYSIFYLLTGKGASLQLAQILFACLYLVNLVIVLVLYSKLAKVVRFPVVLLPFLCLTAYRVHSIFMLRMFNDGVAMVILYLAILFLIEDNWTLGCCLYSVAVSVKMNIVLFSPGLAVLLLRRFGLKGTVERILLCAVIQIVIGFPFLATFPVAYLARAFDLSRVFLFKWTVNWRFLPEWLFLSRSFHLLLLLGHLTTLCVFATKRWMHLARFKNLFEWKRNAVLAPQEIVYVLFTSNFVGVCFSRSLHYQFYVWYFHTLPLLAHWSGLHFTMSGTVLLAIEYCWNVYPSTVLSSLLLHCCHALLLIGLLLDRPKLKQ